MFERRSEDPSLVIDQKKMFAEERTWIDIRRIGARKNSRIPGLVFPGNNRGNEKYPTVGLALSGGGIRSATFNLGLLQALKRWNVLTFVDYMSTVSGGGYIGSCLTWLMSVLQRFPFGDGKEDEKGLGRVVLDWLRSHGKYLVPGKGLNVWSLFAAIIKGTFINLVILVPAFLLVFKLLNLETGYYPQFLPHVQINGQTDAGTRVEQTLFAWFVIAGIGLFLLLLFIIIYAAFSSRSDSCRSYKYQMRFSQLLGYILLLSVALCSVGCVPVVYYVLPVDYIYQSISGVSLTGLVALLGAMKGLSKENETSRLRSLILSVGLGLIVYGIFLLLYHIVEIRLLEIGRDAWYKEWLIFICMFLLTVILSLVTDVNHMSMHRYYRDRLMQAYMPPILSSETFKKNPARGIIDPGNPSGIETDPDTYWLSDINGKAGNPYHIINTNLLTINSRDSKLSARGGDNFILSPIYCGSASTGYCETKEYICNRANLATSFAISGAAVDPNTYLTRSKPVAFLMSLLNVRLGYWIRNPDMVRQKVRPRTQYLIYMLLEMLGFGLSEKKWSIHLADGGHFENLGLYELIRRRCQYIIVSDAGADQKCRFSDLGKAIEMARVDFGVEIDIRLDDLKPDEKTGLSNIPFAIGTIVYPEPSQHGVKKKGGKKVRQKKEICHIIYIKATMIDGLPADITSYKKVNDQFPHESTGDQFFDEDQFEAYRELGFRLGSAIFENRDQKRNDVLYKSMDQVIRKIWKNAYAMKKSALKRKK